MQTSELKQLKEKLEQKRKTLLREEQILIFYPDHSEEIQIALEQLRNEIYELDAIISNEETIQDMMQLFNISREEATQEILEEHQAHQNFLSTIL